MPIRAPAPEGKGELPPKRCCCRRVTKTELKIEDARQNLRYSGRLFGGLKLDCHYRMHNYKDDILDGFKCTCLAAIFFLYFTIMVPEVTFGANLSDITQNGLKVEITLVGAGISGCLFALLGGQPLLIVGTTGPLVLFEKILFKMAVNSIEALVEPEYKILPIPCGFLTIPCTLWNEIQNRYGNTEIPCDSLQGECIPSTRNRKELQGIAVFLAFVFLSTRERSFSL